MEKKGGKEGGGQGGTRGGGARRGGKEGLHFTAKGALSLKEESHRPPRDPVLKRGPAATARAGARSLLSQRFQTRPTARPITAEHANPSPEWVPSLAAQNTGLHNHTNPAKGVALNCSVHRMWNTQIPHLGGCQAWQHRTQGFN